MSAPVLLIWFNRPELSRGQWDLIKDRVGPELYIAVDGPRPGKQDEAERVASCVELARQITTPDHLLVRDHNRGCGRGPSEAISWFFGKVTEGIILEDDCWPHPRFFSFVEELLERYRNDARVMGISGDGTCVVDSSVFRGFSYGFSRIPLIWGWATWKRAWEGYDYHLQDWPVKKLQGDLFDVIIHEDSYNALYDMFENVFTGVHQGIWDYQWVYRVVFSGGAFVIPEGNLITNKGFGLYGTHTSGGSPRADAPYTFSHLQLLHPQDVRPNVLLEESIYRLGLGVRNKPLWRKVLKRLFPKLRGRVTYEHWVKKQLGIARAQ